jgi:hypothetical protein
MSGMRSKRLRDIDRTCAVTASVPSRPGARLTVVCQPVLSDDQPTLGDCANAAALVAQSTAAARRSALARSVGRTWSLIGLVADRAVDVPPT